MLSMASALEKTKKTRCGVFVEVATTSTLTIGNSTFIVFFYIVTRSSGRLCFRKRKNFSKLDNKTEELTKSEIGRFGF